MIINVKPYQCYNFFRNGYGSLPLVNKFKITINI